VACGQSLLYHVAANPNVSFWHKARSTDSPLGRLDRVVSQPHLTLRPEYVQKHSDVLARHSGTKSGATREQAGNNPHAVTSLEAALLREVNRTVALAPADGGDHLVRHMGRLVPALDQTDHSRTPANVVPLQLDAASSGRKIENIFDQFEALGWLIRTPGPLWSKPPHWQVNPEVHRRFAERATQEAVERERNREMLQEIRHTNEKGRSMTQDVRTAVASEPAPPL
jgi:hypothetical protein